MTPTSRSTCFTRYAQQALAVVTALTAVLLPTFSAAGIDVWQRCRDLGAELEPAEGFWALVAGIVIYGVVAVSLAISFLVARSTPEPRP